MKSVFCNWKLNPQTPREAKRLFEATKKIATTHKQAQIIVLPPTIFLQYLAKGYTGSKIEFGAQAISGEVGGSHTGDTSAAQVHASGATFVLIGHAEQRARGITDAEVQRQVRVALSEKLDVIIAVGEHSQDDDGVYVSYIRDQITTALTDVAPSRFKNITIAYEPLWAIGAQAAPSVDEVHKMILLVKKILSDTYGAKALKAIHILYGGSVDEHTAEGIFSISGLHGVLLGRASLHPEQLKHIAGAAEIYA